ncbi:BTB domain-containing protein [Favolaschia claudopus]|uniref:BTB domain-containing protein n=1 Tax=Favolaschia claudopus TaxID=2862362 RepID=A0AAW0EE18_9AGAR
MESDLQRVEDLWFPHGNLVLRAETTIFRVHSDILGARSSVFRDMIAFPQPAQSEGDTLAGQDAVRLHDSAAEVEVFLRAIFDSSFFMPPPSPVTFPAIIGVMRLAHKYDVQFLFRRALSHLELLYPTTLSEYQSGRSIPRTTTQHIREYHTGNSLSAIRAASEVGTLWILPTAYYTMIKDSDTIQAIYDDLRPDEVRMCWTAQLKCARAVSTTHQFLTGIPTESCASDSCRRVASEALNNIECWRDDEVDLDPLDKWVLDYMSPGDALCSGCGDLGAGMFSEEQRRFWEGMPAMFGLPSWAELMEMRREAMKGAMEA